MTQIKERVWSGASGYVLGLLLASVATAVRFALDPWLGDAQTLSLLFAAIALTVWIAGTGPAIVTCLAGYLASDYLFIPPRGMLAIVGVSETVAVCTYLISSTAIIGFGAGMRAANRRARTYSLSLEEKTGELQLAERRKDEFLAILAHELRNPLAPIRSAVHLLIPRSPELDRARDVIDRQSRHLQRLIDDLSDLSRVREGRMRLQRSAVRLDDIINDAIVSVQQQIDAEGHSFELVPSAKNLVVDADPTRLSQVFANLLTNAARYTPPGGCIRMEVARDDATAVIRVCDTGIGIPKDMLPRIFEMYRQLDRPAERARGGLGIGLTIVRQIVQLHGGMIEARSEGENKGSQFVVRLPLLDVAAAELEHPPQGVVAPARQVTDAPCVLLVAFDDAAAEEISRRFGQRGWQVLVARSEAEALRTGARARPRAVVLRVSENRMETVRLCMKLRHSAWGSRALLVAMDPAGCPLAPESAGRANLDVIARDISEAVEKVARSTAAESSGAERDHSAA